MLLSQTIMDEEAPIVKVFSISLTLIAIAIFIYFFVLGFNSKSKLPPGLSGNQLKQCSEKPNCVCSEDGSDKAHFIEPLPFTQIADETLKEKISTIIIGMGGEILVASDTYIAAIFTSSAFRFVDDFEIRVDNNKNVIHIRSASRVGHSDFSVNRKRAEQFKKLFSNSDN